MNTANIAVVGPVEQLPAVPQSASVALIHMIERLARDPSVNVEKLERLMTMQERILERNAKAAYSAALSEMQPKLPVVTRRGKIEVRKKDASGDRTGDIQQSTPYALWEDINEAIRPALAEHGFGLSFRVGMAQDGKITVTGILSHREGHSEETTITLQHDSTGSKNAVQAVGSSVSYGKRYTAGLLLNFTSRGEDDDGRTAPGGFITEAQVNEIEALLKETNTTPERFCGHMKVATIAEIPVSQFKRAIDALNGKKNAAQKVARP